MLSGRLLPALAAFAAALAVGAVPAPAAQPGFALEAAGFPSYPVYRAAPGDQRRGGLRLTNVTRRSLTVLLHAADVTTAATGGLEYGGARPRGAGRWLRLQHRRVRLHAGETQTVDFTLTVPRDASPGDHLAGIVAVNAADQRAASRRAPGEGVQLRFLPRLAIAVQASLPGGRSRELTAGRSSVDVTPTAVTARVPVRHTGDRLVRGVEGRLALMQGDDVLRRQSIDLGAIVPGTDVALQVPFRGTPAEGTYRVVGRVVPEGGEPVIIDQQFRFGERAAEELRLETGREAAAGGSPAIVVALVALAMASLAAALAALLVRQRRLTAELARRSAD